ncbi:MAG: aspartate kinase [Crocinitomicaceae bacterium]|nr:aspartate kinase [Crocinitomicaceae bacterium]|tara:strand:- start:3837 stop:5093 length:1257 start_codon:yes stop_codon:yes gene_type:complete
MRVYKFGGASVKNADAVINIKEIIKSPETNLVILISAMDKTTNNLEKVWELYINNYTTGSMKELDKTIVFHEEIYTKLNLKSNAVFISNFNALVKEIKAFLCAPNSKNHAYCYDQIVSYGELFSTLIISTYLNANGIKNKWLDARELIHTSSHHQEGRVSWEKSKQQILSKTKNQNTIFITQGFIGSDQNKNTTTLGREGSDYSAAIFAWALEAKELVIWKDVPGLLNADPKVFKETQKIDHISYKEAIELSYYGASVIHPKTIKPLQNKGIPLTIRSFIDFTSKGSEINNMGGKDDAVTSFIYKPNQVLISISPKDFSFILEDHMSELFGIFSKAGLKVHLMQNSALSFSVCAYIKTPLISNLIDRLSEKYLVKYNEQVDLLTIRHYQNFNLPEFLAEKEILLEQRSRSTIRYVLKK